MNQTWKNTKNLILDPILTQTWAPNFFLQLLPLLVVRHCSKLSSYAVYRKTNKPTWQNGKKTLILGIIPDFGPF